MSSCQASHFIAYFHIGKSNPSTPLVLAPHDEREWGRKQAWWAGRKEDKRIRTVIILTPFRFPSVASESIYLQECFCK